MAADEDHPTLKLSRYSRKTSVKRPAAEKVNNPDKPPKRRHRKRTSVPIPSFSSVDNWNDFNTSIPDAPPREKKKKLELDASILDTPPKKPEPIVWADADDDDDDDELPPPVFGTSRNIKVPEKKSPVRKVSIESAERESAELPLKLVQRIDNSPLNDVVGSKVTSPEIVDMVEDGGNRALRNPIRARFIKSRMEVDDSSVAKDPATKKVPSRKANETVPPDPAAKEVVFRNQKETVVKGPVTKEVCSRKAKEMEAKVPAAKEVVSRKAKETEAKVPAAKQLVSRKAKETEAKVPAANQVVSRQAKEMEAKVPAAKEVVSRKAKETEAKAPAAKEVVSRKAKETEAKAPAAKEVVSRKAKETVKPENDALLSSVDCLFVQVDPASTTIKDFMISLEAEYGAKLHKDSRAMVKAHLKVLFSGDVEPRDSFPSSTDLQHVAMEERSLKDTSYVHKRNEAVSVAEESNNDTTVFNVGHVDESGHHRGKPKAPQVEPEKQPAQLAEPTKPKTQKRDRRRKNVKSNQLYTELSDHCSATSCNSREPPAKKPKAPAWPRAKKGTCSLCTTCICTIGKQTYTEQTPGGMSRTDAEIERALVRRAKKLEDIVDKYENALDRVKRELKKHRRVIWKKQEAHVNDGKQLAFGDSRFLPDADVWDEQAQAVQQQALPRSVVCGAQATVFGGYHQPTLTQMYGSGSRNGGDDAGEHIDSMDALVDAENDATDLELCSSTVMDENTEDAIEVTEAVEDYADIDPETGPVDHVHRLTWRGGAKEMAQSPLLRGSGVWSALTIKSWTTSMKTSDCLPSFQHDYIASPPHQSNGLLLSNANADKYICAWDALFSDHSDSDDGGGMTQLLDLFQAEMANSDTVSSETMAEKLASSQTSLVEALVLTQRGLSLVEAIEDRMTSDPVRLQAVEAVCPNWRDSVRYALAQRGEDDVREALDRVQHSIENLNRMKEKIPDLLKKQELVLQLFEMSLTESLTRLVTSVGPNNNCDEY